MRIRRSTHILSLAVAMAAGSSAIATTVNWSGGNSGNSTNWNATNSWSGDVLPADDITSDIAAFGLAIYTNRLPVVNASRSIAGLLFTGSGTVGLSGSYSLSLGGSGIDMRSGAGAATISAPLALAAPQTWCNNSTASMTVSGNIINNANALTIDGNGNTSLSGILGNGAGGVIKNGTGTLTLTRANTFSGGMNLNAGTLIVNGSSALGTGAFNIGNATGSTAVTISAATAASIKSSPINWNQDFTLSGSYGLSIGNTLTLSGGTRQVTVSTATNTLIVSGTIDDAGHNFGLTKAGAGSLCLSVANTYTGTTTLAVGVLSAGNIQALGGISAPLLLSGGTLILATETSINHYNTTITGNVSIISTRTGSGDGITHTLGTLNINASASTLSLPLDYLVPGNAGLTFGATTLAADGAVFDTAAGTVLTLGSLSGNFSFTKQGPGQLFLNNLSSRTAGQVTLANGTVTLGHPGALGAATVPLVLSGGTLNLAADSSINAHNTTISAGTTILADRATDGPALTHSLGDLSIGTCMLTITILPVSHITSGTPALAFGPTTLTAPNATFNTAGTNLTLGALSGEYAFTKQGSGILTLTSASGRTSGAVTLSAGKLVLGDAAALGSSGVTLAIGGTSVLDLASDSSVNAHNVTISGTVTILADRASSGTGITHTLGTLSIGSRTLTLDKGANVTSGTAGIAFGATTLTGNATINTASGVCATLASVTVSNNGILTVGGSGNTTISGAITMTNGTLAKTGAGQLTLLGSNSYSGTTTLSAGTLQANDGSSLSSAFLSLNGGVLQTTGTTSFTRGLAATGTSKFQWTSSGGGFSAHDGKLTATITVGSTSNAELTWGTTAGTTIYGTLKFGSPTANYETELTNPINLNAATRTIDVTAGTGGDFATLSNTIRTLSGTAGLTKTGNGILRLSAINTYNGLTSVNAGTLLVDGTLTASAVTVANTATLGGIGTINGTTQLLSGATLNPGSLSTIGTLTLGALTLADGSKLHFDLTNAASYDQLLFSSLSATGNHTLEISLTSLSPLYPGDVFHIFNQSIPDGTFTTFILPDAYTWNTNSLATSGQISILTSSVPEPTPLLLGFAGLLPLAAGLLRRRTRRAGSRAKTIPNC